MKLISPSLEYSDAFMAFLWVHSQIYIGQLLPNHQKLNTASGRYYLVFFPVHIAAHIYGLIHYVIISLFGHLPVNHIQHTFFEQYRTCIWKIKLTCGNLCSLLASSLSQFNSSIPSEGPGLLQPHISSSKAQSPALEEATWGEAVRNI